MLELDLMLLSFVEKALDDLTETQMELFETLLSVTDPQLYAWLIGTDIPADRELFSIVELVKSYNQAC